MEKNVINKINPNRFLLKILICLGLLFTVLLLPVYSNVSLGVEEETNTEYRYLSDIPYETGMSSAGWDRIRYDETYYGPITVRVEGANYTFEKGIWAHATSTVVYNLTEYPGYDYFTAYLGIDTSSARGDGVKFDILTSQDGTTWESKLEEPIDKQRLQDSEFVKINIKNAKYLKLCADAKAGNASDHSVYADAKLIKSTYEEPGEKLVPKVAELDKEIKKFIDSNADFSKNQEYELTLLKRELIDRAGNYALKRFLSENEENRVMYEWLTSNLDVLRLYMLGGTPDGGSYYNSLTELSRLYDEYSSDFENDELLNNPTYPEMTYGDLYKKMAMSIALTHSQRVGLWMQNSTNGENNADALRRYAIFKHMHKNGKFKATDSMDMTHMFEDLHVEEMRFVLQNSIDDEEILWLNKYVQDKIDAEPGRTWSYLTPHPYIAYVWPNYGNNIYYENHKYFNELFAVKNSNDNKGKILLDENNQVTDKIGLFDSEFVIPGGKNITEYRLKITEGTLDYKLYKVWMNFRNKFGTGAVCGGISKSGSNIRGTHGIPATVVGQPGHAALLYYSKDAKGRGFWRLDNDVSGWTLTEKGERMLLGWGNGSHSRGYYQGVYMEYAQSAINDYQNLVKAEEFVMLAKVYNSDLADETKKADTLDKQEKIYRKALAVQSINFDAWLGLINVYNANTAKTENNFYDLSEEIATALKCFPLPMYNATNLLKPKITSIENSYRFTLLQARALKTASELPDNTDDSFTVVQPGLTRLEANYLLGKMDKTIATFSFDGEDAGKIVLASRFDGVGVSWDYSIDGKRTWKQVSFAAEEEHKWQLTPEEIANITSTNDIYVHIIGVDHSDKNLYLIDITEQALPTILFPNDLENRIVGTTLGTEWRYKETDSWTLYSVSSPDLTGNKTVQVRQSATGTTLTSPASEMYQFTEDNQPDTRKYIPVSHLNIQEVSTEATSHGGAAINSIDANYNTRWHSAWNGSDQERFITIKLDRSVVLSAVEFVPAGGGNGKILDGTIYGSLDGKTWEKLTEMKNITYTNQANTNKDAIANTKSFEITDKKEVQYVKIVANRASNGNWFTARAFNLYQDLTKNPHPTAGIAYSTTSPTSGTVIARLINPSKEITITNNEGKDTYVFTKNGEFTFEFQDKDGNTGSALAKVNWIDKDDPTADIKYELDDDKKLIVLLENISEDVYLLDENNNKINYIEVNDNKKVISITYLDDEGNAYKRLDKDEKGITNKITYKNTTNKVQNVREYITTLKDGVVIKEEYKDIEGNPIELTKKEDIDELRKLQEVTRSNPLEHALQTSGEYEFKLLDKAENLLYKSIKVDYIDNDTKILASDITYNTTKPTNKDVEATINPYMIDTNGGKDVKVVIVNNASEVAGNKHTFIENGKFIFKYKEASDSDNSEVKEHEARVDWIDKIEPTAQISYNIQEDTDKPVIASLVNESEEITITNNGNSRDYTFTENGEFKFEFIDKAGNTGYAVAKVDWIKKDVPIEITSGDINQDGQINATDILLVKRHLVADEKQEWILTEDKFKAGDINEDGDITATDLILIKRLVLEQMEKIV